MLLPIGVNRTLSSPSLHCHCEASESAMLLTCVCLHRDSVGPMPASMDDLSPLTGPCEVPEWASPTQLLGLRIANH